MPSVHFLNVAPGDCTLILHRSDRVSMIDICDANIEREDGLAKVVEAMERIKAKGNFRMCEKPANPLDYLDSLSVNRVFRFILTHPDMDHMDGIGALLDEVSVCNFWYTGVEREAPDFSDGGGCFKEADWKRYLKLRDGKEDGVTSLRKLAGAKFSFANQNEDGTGVGDALSILAPDKGLVEAASDGGDINDGSYVILYRSAGGRILFGGDAHDATWEYVLKHHLADVKNCSVMIAPHHGRDSSRSYEFLDKIKPKLTLFGCAPSKFLAYDEWSKRKLDVLTSNQAGNIVIEVVDEALKVYVENESFASANGRDCSQKNAQGYILDRTIPKPD